MKKISRAQGIEVHKLQSEYMQLYTMYPKLRARDITDHLYTDEMQAFKDMMKRKHTEKKRKESECASDSVCIKADLTYTM